MSEGQGSTERSQNSEGHLTLSPYEASLRKLLRVHCICHKSNKNQVKKSRLVAMRGGKLPEVEHAESCGCWKGEKIPQDWSRLFLHIDSYG